MGEVIESDIPKITTYMSGVLACHGKSIDELISDLALTLKMLK